MLNPVKMKRELKSVFRCNDYFSAQSVKTLRKMGFLLEIRGRKTHPCLIYVYGDIKIQFTLAGSGSDKRSGLNLVSDIMRKLIRNGVFGAGVKHE
ncbi:hypothetical protein IKR20_06620 [bacterium]|nr:hypothetical protein [bacterium]